MLTFLCIAGLFIEEVAVYHWALDKAHPCIKKKQIYKQYDHFCSSDSWKQALLFWHPMLINNTSYCYKIKLQGV